MPQRSFNTTGLCVPGEHYMLDSLRGIGGNGWTLSTVIRRAPGTTRQP